jgi:exodeoxyribonuclease VII small subunit
MTEKSFNFNECLKRLEEIAEKLEQPDIDIEEALVLLEEGMKLHKECNQKLAQYQTKIKDILKEEAKDETIVTGDIPF